MKKRMKVITLICCCFMLFGCGSKNENKIFSTLTDFEGSKIAVLTGTRGDEIATTNIKDTRPQYYNDAPSAVLAVTANKVDAYLINSLTAKLVCEKNSELMVFTENVEAERIGFAFQKENPLKQQVETVMDKFKADGTLEKIINRWSASDYLDNVIPTLDYKPDYNGSAGVIRFGFDPVKEPMMFLGKNAEKTGLDVELMTYIAYELNMELKLVDTAVSARIEALNSGKIDIGGCSMTITPEREEAADFVHYYDSATTLIILKENYGGEVK